MATTPFSVPRFRLLLLACFLLWAVFHAVILYLYRFPLQTAITDSFITNALLLLTCALLSNVLHYYLPTHQRYVYVLVLCVVSAIVWIVASRSVFLFVSSESDAYSRLFYQSLPVRFSIGFLIIGCMALVSVLWYTVQDGQETELRRTEAGRLTKEAELFKLRQQLQPHFLFNSLNSINALIGSKPAEARAMIQQLADFLRGTLKKEDNIWVSLEDELQHLNLYLEIEKVRFGHRLVTIITNETGGVQSLLPAMLLQPVVENAIKFGLYDVVDTVAITITATRDKETLTITVQNPFDPHTSGIQGGTGFGLSSVQRRLYLLFARTDLVQTEAAGNQFITTLKIPQPHDKSSTDR